MLFDKGGDIAEARADVLYALAKDALPRRQAHGSLWTAFIRHCPRSEEQMLFLASDIHRLIGA